MGKQKLNSLQDVSSFEKENGMGSDAVYSFIIFDGDQKPSTEIPDFSEVLEKDKTLTYYNDEQAGGSAGHFVL